MSSIVLYIATSLDGYIARKDGSIDWLPSPESGVEAGSYDHFFSSTSALIMGATTYEQVLSFGDWVYGAKPCYVLTSRPFKPANDSVNFVSDLDELLRMIDVKKYPQIWLMGGAKTIQGFWQKQLIRQLIITVIPIVLGSGISLYDCLPETKLKLQNMRTGGDGTVELRYLLVPNE